MNLPVDFEQKVKLPPQVNGRSYPYQISAKDLMQDFRYAALQVDGSEVNGLRLVENIALDGSRTISLAGQLTVNLAHPWEVVSNGDATISIYAGKILGIRDAGTPGNYPWNFVYFSYAGGSIEVTSSSGWIYAIVDVTVHSIFEDGAINSITVSQEPTGITVVFDESDPSTVAIATGYQICIPIAQVVLSNGIATVVDQVLTYNPMLTIEAVYSMP